MLIEGSQDNILTTVDTITLQSDMTYTIQVSFSNLDGLFNITSNSDFSKLSVIYNSHRQCIIIQYNNYIRLLILRLEIIFTFNSC